MESEERQKGRPAREAGAHIEMDTNKRGVARREVSASIASARSHHSKPRGQEGGLDFKAFGALAVRGGAVPEDVEARRCADALDRSSGFALP